MSHKKGQLRQGSLTYQLKAFIEAGNEPTTSEVADFLYNEHSAYAKKLACQILAGLRRHYRIFNIPFNAIKDPETGEWRHKKLKTAEEVVSKVDGERKTCETNFKNICLGMVT